MAIISSVVWYLICGFALAYVCRGWMHEKQRSCYEAFYWLVIALLWPVCVIFMVVGIPLHSLYERIKRW